MFGSILWQFSASNDRFEGRSDVFRASKRHFGASGALLARARELPEAGWRSIFGSKKSKILKFSGIAQNRSGMSLGSVWEHFVAIFSIQRSF